VSTERPSLSRDRQAELLALAGELQPELHRYCARLMGSVIDGEDVVQDAFARALVALEEIDEMPQIRPWLFRIAHNRAARSPAQPKNTHGGADRSRFRRC